MIGDWKACVRLLLDQAVKDGVGIVTPAGEDGFRVVGSGGFRPEPGTETPFPKEPTPKELRRWLWENRRRPFWKEDAPLVLLERTPEGAWKGMLGRPVPDDGHPDTIVFVEVPDGEEPADPGCAAGVGGPADGGAAEGR